MGDHLEANKELERITAKLRAHPDVLELRWQIYAKAKKWDACLDIAKAITELAPDRSYGWIHLSYALLELKRTTEAWENLLVASVRFPQEPTIAYNLACYACQLGRLSDGQGLLEKAFQLGDPKKLKLMALDDPDLEPLWKELRE